MNFKSPVKCFVSILSLFFLSIGWVGSIFGNVNYTIRDIRVIGNITIADDLLIAHAGLNKGVTIGENSHQLIDHAIRNISQYEGIKTAALYLTDIDQENATAICLIQVEEYPRLANHLIQGLNKKDSQALLQKITLPTHAAVSPTLLQKTTADVKNFFLSKGFYQVQVTTTLIPSKEAIGKVTLQIKVHKGNKNTVHKITFEGNKQFEDSLLIFYMKELKEAPRFTLVKDIIKKIATLAPIRKGGILLGLPKTMDEVMHYFSKHTCLTSTSFTEEKYLKAKENLIQFYQSKGFRDARIVAEKLQHATSGKLTINLKIDEGKQYTIRHIQWVGNYIYSDQELNNRLHLTDKKIYDPIYIRNRLRPSLNQQTIGDLYYNNGYLKFYAEAVETAIQDNLVDLEIRIQEGKQAIINQVAVTGNTITQDEIIYRALQTLPGEKYNLRAVHNSLQALTMLQFFEPPAYPIMDVNETGDKVNLTYQLKEKINLTLSLQLHTPPPVAEVSFGTKNFSLKNLFRGKVPLGAGQSLQFQFAIKNKYKRFGIEFQEPFLFQGKRNHGFYISLFHAGSKSTNEQHIWDKIITETLHPFRKFNKISTTHTIASQIGLTSELTKYCHIRYGLGYCYTNYQNYRWLAGSQKETGTLHDVHMEVSIKHDSSNHPYYPTKGFIWFNSLTCTPPYSYFGHGKSDQASIPRVKEYGKLMVDMGYFQHLGKQFVLYLKGHMGFLSSLSNKKLPFQRFHLGGVQLDEGHLLDPDFISLKGYPDDSLSPLDSYKNTTIKGGTLFNKFAIELRYPLIRMPLCLYLVTFMEAGNVWMYHKNYNPLTMKKSIGVGFQLGPLPIIGSTISLYYGYRLDDLPKHAKAQSSNKYQWHFTLYPIFR